MITLSQLMTQGSGSPCSGPSSTSDRMPRMVRVIGAQVSAVASASASRIAWAPRRRSPGLYAAKLGWRRRARNSSDPTTMLLAKKGLLRALTHSPPIRCMRRVWPVDSGRATLLGSNAMTRASPFGIGTTVSGHLRENGRTEVPPDTRDE